MIHQLALHDRGQIEFGDALDPVGFCLLLFFDWLWLTWEPRFRKKQKQTLSQRFQNLKLQEVFLDDQKFVSCKIFPV